MRGLSLAERLEALKAAPMLDLDDLEDIKLAPTEPEISYQSKLALTKPNEKLFLALYTPYIKQPLKFDWFIYRDFKPFLLGDAIYVLNTFQPLAIDRIFAMYLEKLKPQRMTDYAKLCHFCGHLELTVPGFYQDRIEAIIKTIKPCEFFD